MFGTLRRRLFALPIELERAGVLGINRRNLAFVQASNPRALYPRVAEPDPVQTGQVAKYRGRHRTSQALSRRAMMRA